jgi:hypothetical protein
VPSSRTTARGCNEAEEQEETKARRIEEAEALGSGETTSDPLIALPTYEQSEGLKGVNLVVIVVCRHFTVNRSMLPRC